MFKIISVSLRQQQRSTLSCLSRFSTLQLKPCQFSPMVSSPKVIFESFKTTDISISRRDYSAKKSKDKGGKNKPKVSLTPQQLNQVINYDEFVIDMKGLIEHLKRDLSENLSLKISPATIEQLNIKTDKGNVKLGELVQVEVKSSTSYVVDLITCPEHKKSIFDALVKSNLNLNPQINQHTIYLTIPKVTREHRENVAKSAKLKCSQAIEKMKKVAAKAERKAQDAKHVSSDVVFNTVQFLKFQNESFAKEAGDLRDAKIKEILNE